MIQQKLYRQFQSFLPMTLPLFSVVRDLNTSAHEINDDLKKTESWAHQWQMSSDPAPLKQPQEVIFSRKEINPSS